MRYPSLPAAASHLSLPNAHVVVAFAAVYVLWGGSYVGVTLAVETLPPLFMMAVRCLIAGALLLAVALARAYPWPARREWRAASIAGVLFFVICHGALAYAQQRVPPGLAALLMATVPLFVPLVSWLRPGGQLPSPGTIAGIGGGFAGVALLIMTRNDPLADRLDMFHVALLLLAALSWAVATIVSRELPLPASPFQAAGMELLIGGVFLLVASAALGEFEALNPATVSERSLLGLGYLILFSSLLAFCAYVFLLRTSTPERVATYAYVNPVVAVLLGWLLLGEQLTATMLIAALIILGAVAATVGGTIRHKRLTPCSQHAGSHEPSHRTCG
jgi:drug/metabolite transporter (DMT)-like permease